MLLFEIFFLDFYRHFFYTFRKICLQNSGTLIRLIDNANWNFLKTELPKHYLPDSAFYIGLSDIATDGAFEWEHDLNEINKDGLYNKYIYPYYGERWCKYEPNGRNSLECVAIRIDGNSICYEDRNCSVDLFYGCEMRKRSTGKWLKESVNQMRNFVCYQ